MPRTRHWLTSVMACLALVSVVPGGSATGYVTPPRTPALEAPRPEPASSTALSASAAEGGRTTTIGLRVTTCARCPVTLQQALGDGTSWSSRTHHVRGGTAKFTVSSRRTRGMTFVLNPAWANVTNAVTDVVTRYAHTTPRQVISNDVAKHKKRATPLLGRHHTTPRRHQGPGRDVHREGTGRRSGPCHPRLVQADEDQHTTHDSHLAGHDRNPGCLLLRRELSPRSAGWARRAVASAPPGQHGSLTVNRRRRAASHPAPSPVSRRGLP
jgi:hypothetical protein